MSTDTHSLQNLQQTFRSMSARAPLGDCPDPDRLWSAVRLRLPAEARREIVRHTAVCSTCAEDWRVSWALWKKEQESDSNGSGGDVLNGPWRTVKKVLPQVAAAGLVVLAVGMGGLIFRETPAPDTHRAGQSLASPAPDRTELLVEEGAVFPRDEVILDWTLGPEGSLYQLEVLTLDGDRIFIADRLEESRYHVPAEKLARVPSGGEVYWQVTWFTPDDVAGVRKGPNRIRLQ